MKKLGFVAFYFACAVAVLMAPASAAYVDPTVTTFVISGVVAVVVAASAVIMSVVRKARKKAMEVLNIDENEHKAMEDDLVVFDEEAEKPAGEKTE